MKNDLYFPLSLFNFLENKLNIVRFDALRIKYKIFLTCKFEKVPLLPKKTVGKSEGNLGNLRIFN